MNYIFKYHYFLWILLGFHSCFSKKEKPIEMNRPNILWIVSDDLGTDLGCYGNSLVKTPHLDQLAKESIVFTNMHSVSAVCSPSRSSLITGVYPISIDCHQHRTQFKRALPDTIKPITYYFKKAGYFVSNGSSKNKLDKGKTDYNFIHHSDSLFNGTHWNQRKKGQPFFAQIQIYNPHRPFKRDTLNPINPDLVQLPPYLPNHELARKDWAYYLESVQLVDQEVGKILKELEKDGVLENTLVFFFGDQGRPHVRSKQFLYDGGTNTPLLIKGIKNKEGLLDDQLVSTVDIPAMTLALADITIPKYMAGINILDSTQSRDYIFTMRDRRDETVDRIRAIRTKDFKYIKNYYPEKPYTQPNVYKKFQYPMLTLMRVLNNKKLLTPEQAQFLATNRPEEELYDLQKDPFELYNLADDKLLQSKKNELQSILKEYTNQYDKGSYPEPKSETDYAVKIMQERWMNQMKKRGLSPNVTDEEYLKYFENNY